MLNHPDLYWTYLCMDRTDKHEQLNTTQLTALIDRAPNIFMGCSAPEINALALLSALFFIVGFIVVFSVLQVFSLAMGAGISLAFSGFYLMISMLKRIKRTKPNEHYLLILLKWRARMRLQQHLVIRSGNWGVSRLLNTKDRL